jgi:hypothetical protein
MKNKLLFSFVAILLASCGTYQFSSRRVEVAHSPIQTTPLVADLKVDFSKKITTYSSWMKSASEAKGDAYLKAITENNIDVLVDPIYKIESKPRFLVFFPRSQATVYGFAGTYENPRSKLSLIGEFSSVDKENIEKYNMVMGTTSVNNGEFGAGPSKKKGLLSFFRK